MIMGSKAIHSAACACFLRDTVRPVESEFFAQIYSLVRKIMALG
jgi:hypothetical protein